MNCFAFSAFSAFSYPFSAGESPSRTEKTFSGSGLPFSVYLLIIHSPSSRGRGDASSPSCREGPALPELHSTTTQRPPGPSSGSTSEHSHLSAFPSPWPGAPNPQSISPTSATPKLPHFSSKANPSVTLSWSHSSQSGFSSAPRSSLMPKPGRFYRHTLPKPFKIVDFRSSPFLIQCPFSASEKCFLPVSKLVHHSFLCYIFVSVSLDGSLRHFTTFPPPPLPAQCHTSQIECAYDSPGNPLQGQILNE